MAEKILRLLAAILFVNIILQFEAVDARREYDCDRVKTPPPSGCWTERNQGKFKRDQRCRQPNCYKKFTWEYLGYYGNRECYCCECWEWE